MHMSRISWSGRFGPDRLCDLILHEYKFVSRRHPLYLCPASAIPPRSIPFRTIGVGQAACSIAGGGEAVVTPRRWWHQQGLGIGWISARFRGPSAVLRDEDISINRTGLVDISVEKE